MAVERIVSLIPAGTEIVAALGFGDKLVGRSHECDFPEVVRGLPALTASNFDAAGLSGVEIDQTVRELIGQGKPLYRIDEKKLRELRPQVVVTQAQCDVCAVDLDEVERVCKTFGQPCQVVAVQGQSLNDLWQDIIRVAKVLEAVTDGLELVMRLKQRLFDIRQKAASATHKPTVACVEWMEPLMVSGNWMPEMVETAGGINLFSQGGRHSPEVGWGEFMKQDPETVVVMPCGYGLARTRKELSALTKRTYWDLLKAVRGTNVFLADGNSFFNRPGPRLVESTEMLAEIFHPDLFMFGHEGNGWERI